LLSSPWHKKWEEEEENDGKWKRKICKIRNNHAMMNDFVEMVYMNEN